MKSFFTLAALAAGTNALVGRSDSCCFHLTSSGGASGPLGQLSDGQIRIGDNSLSPAQFCINSSGAITDSAGRGCIITSETTQFQCDEGAAATPGFSMSSSGELEFHGSSNFIACETGQNGGMNVYTTNSTSVTQCKNVDLTADSCSGSGAGASSSAVASSTPMSSMTPSSTPVVPSSSVPVSSSSPARSTPVTPAPASSTCLSGPPVTTTVTVTDCGCAATSVPSIPASTQSSAPSAPALSSSAPALSSTAPALSSSAPSAPAPSSPAGGSSMTSVPASSSASATASSGSSCPTTLSGNYEYPHLIISVNSASPDTAYGTQFNGTVTSSISSIFNFDIPSSDSGKTCSLVFLFPQKADLETSSYSFSGDGKIDFAKLSGAASSSTTYNNVPSVSQDLGELTVSPGNSYVVSTFSCPAGETVAYEMKNAGSTNLNFFEDYNPSPLGLYITVC